MTLAFEIGDIKLVEFGVGRRVQGETDFVLVPVNLEVQKVLREMANVTWNNMIGFVKDPSVYEPSEKYQGTEYLLSPRGKYDEDIRRIHEARNLSLDARALDEPAHIVSYFARFVDCQNQKLTALKRAAQFKGVLKRTLVQLVDDSLKLVEDRIFKLDADYDVLLDSDTTRIWRPGAFEFLANLKDQILERSEDNAKRIQRELEFVRFNTIETYARSHTRAARLLASINNQELAEISPDRLMTCCNEVGVEVEEKDGEVIVPNQQVLGFLEVLDRRRYAVELIPESTERFKASSRSRVDTRTPE